VAKKTLTQAWLEAGAAQPATPTEVTLDAGAIAAEPAPPPATPRRRVTFNGEAGTRWKNDTGQAQYQFVCDLVRTCGACLQYHMAIGPWWPIPIHRNCRCKQYRIEPNAAAPHEFVDFREVLDGMTQAQKRIAIGASNYKLLTEGVVKWDEIVTRYRVRTLQEVVAVNKVTIGTLEKAGVRKNIAKRAYAAVHTPEQDLIRRHQAELVKKLEKAGVSQDELARELARQIVGRVGIAGGPKPETLREFLPPSPPHGGALAALLNRPKGPKKPPSEKPPAATATPQPPPSSKPPAPPPELAPESPAGPAALPADIAEVTPNPTEAKKARATKLKTERKAKAKTRVQPPQPPPPAAKPAATVPLPKPLPPRPSSGFQLTGTRPSDVLDLSKAGTNRASAERVSEVLDRLHGVSGLGKIPVTTTVEPGQQGSAYFTAHGAAARIGVIEGAARPELTMAHEFGHLVEGAMLPGGNGGKRIWEGQLTSPIMDEWKAAIEKSRAFQNLDAPVGQKDLEKPLEYLLRRDELWARSYAQWAAWLSQDPVMLQQLRSAQAHTSTLMSNWQWQDDDFQEIGKAIEAIFRRLGRLVAE
jgi:hypothetical protein